MYTTALDKNKVKLKKCEQKNVKYDIICKYTDTKELHSIRIKAALDKNKNIFGQVNNIIFQ